MSLLATGSERFATINIWNQVFGYGLGLKDLIGPECVSRSLLVENKTGMVEIDKVEWIWSK